MTENSMVISVDAMGGDNSPRVVIEGVAIAAKEHPDIKFLLFGDTAKVSPILAEFPELKSVCELRHAPEMVHNEDKPSSVSRKHRSFDGNFQINPQNNHKNSSSGDCQHYAASLWALCDVGFGRQYRM